MLILMNSKWFLFFLLITTCVLITSARRGGGGSRGGSRSSSSRSSSSSSRSRSSSSSSTHYGGSSRSDYSYKPIYAPPRPPPPPPPRPRPPPPPPPPPRPPPPPPPPKPKYPPVVVRQPAVNPHFKESNPNQGFANRQPAYNPNYKESNPNQVYANRQPGYNPNYKDSNFGSNQHPPAYSPRENPPGYNQAVASPAYSPHGSSNVRYNPGHAPPSYSAGVPGANYPRQPGMSGGNYPHHGGVNYHQQPGTFSQPGVGVPGANYPRQQYTYQTHTLGSKVWQPQSGSPAPAYMNYGGIPTGTNMYSKPEKKKGFLGSLVSMGPKKPHKNKYYESHPSPYGMGGGMGGMGPMGGGFTDKHGSKAAMYTMLPYMAAKKRPKFYRPRFGYYPSFYHRPYHHHHYHYGHYSHTHYDVYHKEYVGTCIKPLTPDHGKVNCYSTREQVDCDVKCDEGYIFPDNATRKSNKCWHVTGVWKPLKNFPACQPVCNRTCMNGGTCKAPNVCACPPEYRGLQCEFDLKICNFRNFSKDAKIKSVCTYSKNETACKISCKGNLQFATPTEETYKCSPNGTWTPSTIPECIEPGSISNATEVTTQGKETLENAK